MFYMFIIIIIIGFNSYINKLLFSFIYCRFIEKTIQRVPDLIKRIWLLFNFAKK